MDKKKVDKPKTWLLIENPQFLSNLHETRWKYLSHEYFMFLEFQLDWMETVNFLLVAKFKACLLFFYPYFSSLIIQLEKREIEIRLIVNDIGENKMLVVG